MVRCYDCDVDKSIANFSNSQLRKAPRCRCMECTGVTTQTSSAAPTREPQLGTAAPQAVAPQPQLGTAAPQAAPQPRCVLGDQVKLSWPASLPNPTDAQEQRAIRAILPGVDFGSSKRSVQSALNRYPARWEDFSSRQQNHFKVTCDQIGFDIGQAIGLRNTVYRSAQPWKFQGFETEALAKAEALEDDVESVLAAQGVEYETQSQQIDAHYAAAQTLEEGAPTRLPPTPDFKVSSRLFINDRPVRWIEVKNFYGAGIDDNIKPWMPTIKVQNQIRKYIEAYGPDGAVILRHGYAERFRNRTPSCVQLLDAGLLRQHCGEG